MIPNKNKDKEYTTSVLVAKKLKSLNFNVFVEKKFETNLSDYAMQVEDIPSNIDLIIVIGGDGSVIDASVLAVKLNLPVLGINLGNLGYLSEVEPEELDILDRLKSGTYKIEEKMLLSVRKCSDSENSSSPRFAVNDVIVSHESFLGIAEFTLTNSYGESIKYRADGLILSTPAGSTAYSLSAGGPIISHDINSILATPICPHSFFNRSIIFKETEQLCLCNKSRSDLKISVDGRLFAELQYGEKCCVSSSDKKFLMLTFSENNMFSTLFGKMKRLENI